MDTTIRGLDDDAYRALKAWAALRGETIGAALSEIVLAHTARPAAWPRKRSILDWEHADYGKGSEHLSEEVAAVVYGT